MTVETLAKEIAKETAEATLCECGEPLAKCHTAGCGSGERLCLSCDWECFCSESDTVQCRTCQKKEIAYWRRYFGGSVKAHVDSCEALGIPSSSSDTEIMAAAREVK